MGTLYDVVIVGAGPGGSAAAYYLAMCGLNTLLLDKFPFPRDKTCGDGLSPRALRALDQMGMLDEALRVGCHLGSAKLVAPNGSSVSMLIPSKNSRSDHMLTVPRLLLDQMLLQHALASGAQLMNPAQVTNVVQDGDEVIVQGEQHTVPFSVKARLVIIATGANTTLLRRMGVLKRNPLMMLAARAYFEGVTHLDDEVQLHFEGIPLPGYGWVFPLTASSANVGAIVFRSQLTAQWRRTTAREAFDSFVQIPLLQRALANAQRAGPVKGYPLRVDFARAPTFGERVLLVGEAAGLVNPLTGEGIEYALESARLAAEHIREMLDAGDLSLRRLADYDVLLRQHYQRLFVLCGRLRWLYNNPLILNQFIKAAARRRELEQVFISIIVDSEGMSDGLSPQILLKTLFTR